MIAVPFHQNAAATRGFIVFSRLVAVLMGAVALVVLAGWCFSAPLMTTLVPGQHAMKANAAIAFALSGAALFLTQDFVNHLRATKRTGKIMGTKPAWKKAYITLAAGQQVADLLEKI